MTNITIQKLKKEIKGEVAAEVKRELQKLFKTFFYEEITPHKLKKLEKISSDLDTGKKGRILLCL